MSLCQITDAKSSRADRQPQTMLVSSGSAAVLGLKNIRTRAKSNTVYLMNEGGCEFNCSFCAQAKDSSSQQRQLSRVSWPQFKWEAILNSLQTQAQQYKRVCMQVVNTPDIFERLPEITRKLRQTNPGTKIAMTVRTHSPTVIDALFQAGADEVGLSIDAIDPVQFSKIKGGRFERHKQFILDIADRYPGKIATHLIIGMGESERQAIELMCELQAHRIIIALFAFTPVKGAKMEFDKTPDISSYRRVQAALHLIRNGLGPQLEYDERGRVISFGMSDADLIGILQDSNAFETSGCSDCNRPYYNERAGAEELYNHPCEVDSDRFSRVFDSLFTYV
ncbi:MAG: radical SAM protein [bacterium]|nr:radical SAM protein [bacterium]